MIYGAGAIGGTIGGRLAQHGHEVVSIEDQGDYTRFLIRKGR